MPPVSQRVVLFLCTGNYYRSRFAEILFNSIAARMGLPWKAASRGLALERGINNVGPIAREAVRALEAMGVRDTAAMARMPEQVKVEDLQAADRIVALKHDEHRPLLEDRFAGWAEKVEFWEVDDDPEALALVERDVMGLVARLLGGGGAGPNPSAAAPSKEPPAKKPITLKVGRETAGRRGKGVTTVFDTGLDEVSLNKLATTLKQKCGTGGTVKDGRIEIQGDQRERIVVELEKLRYKVKRVGG